MTTIYEDFLHDLDRQSIESRARVRRLILEAGRPDLLAAFDKDMKELDNGVRGVRNAWHSLTSKQRFVLRLMGSGRYMSKSLRCRSMFDALGKAPAILSVCKVSTLRALSSRELIHVNGGPFDPEDSFVITERGSFVLKHGPTE